MSWPSVMVVRLRNTDMSTTTPQTRGRQYILTLTRHAYTWDAAAILWGRRRCYHRSRRRRQPKRRIRRRPFHHLSSAADWLRTRGTEKWAWPWPNAPGGIPVSWTTSVPRGDLRLSVSGEAGARHTVIAVEPHQSRR
jgi:hypothetical protein